MTWLAPATWLALSTASILSTPGTQTAAPDRSATDLLPNVVLFLVDDQGFTGTSVQIDPKIPQSRSDFYRTPQLERLAARGMQFSRAYAPHSLCAPARAGIQTGKSATQLHLTMNPPTNLEMLNTPEFLDWPMVQPVPATGISEDEVTIAEVLRQQHPEYATAHFGKWHLRCDPQQQGYTESDGNTDNSDDKHADPEDPKRVFELTRRTVDFLRRQAEAQKPCFVQLSHYAVHQPIHTRPEAMQTVSEWPLGERHQDRSFAAMSWDVDLSLGMILDALDELGDYGRRTYVIYFSDNGGTFLNRTDNLPLREGKGSLTEGGLRVPMFVSGPGIAPGSLCEVPVTGLDFLPTIAAWAGLTGPLPAGIEGGDLGPLLENGGQGKVKRPDPFLVFHSPHYLRGKTPVSVLIDGKFKLFHWYEDDRYQLYDIESDPGESTDVAKFRARRVKLLSEELEQYLTAVHAQRPLKWGEAAGEDGTPLERKKAEHSAHDGDGDGESP